MKTYVQKWGNSLAVRIPRHFVRETGLEYNTAVEMKIEDGKLVIQRIEAAPNLAELLARVTDENLHDGVESGESVGKEAW